MDVKIAPPVNRDRAGAAVELAVPAGLVSKLKPPPDAAVAAALLAPPRLKPATASASVPHGCAARHTFNSTDSQRSEC